jgi:hypothetical protein
LSPPRIVALLHLDNPNERQAMETLHRYTTGPRAIWRVLGMRRDANFLRLAVKWSRRRAAPWFALVTIAVGDGSVCCLFQDSATAARQALRDGATNTQPTAKA